VLRDRGLAIGFNDLVISRHNRARIRVQLVGEMDKARGDWPTRWHPARIVLPNNSAAVEADNFSSCPWRLVFETWMTKPRRSELLTPDSIQVKSGRLLRFCQVFEGMLERERREARRPRHALACYLECCGYIR
jgi:hypothetical protein